MKKSKYKPKRKKYNKYKSKSKVNYKKENFIIQVYISCILIIGVLFLSNSTNSISSNLKSKLEMVVNQSFDFRNFKIENVLNRK